MGFNDLLKKLFGNKSQRDLKEIEPYIQKIKAISPELEKLSNDELRHRIDVVKQHIQDSVADDRKRIAELKEHVETLDYDKRESTWEEIDKIEKEILKKIEDVLDESLPEVFAVMKETARRFSQNETVEVTANDFDRSLAVDHDFIHIEGDKAIYANHWMVDGAVTLLQKDNVADNICASIGTERIVRQTDGTQQIGTFCHVLAGGAVLAVHGVAAGNKGNNAARSHLVDGFRKEIIVDAKTKFVVRLVVDLVLTEWHVTHRQIVEITTVGGLKARHGNVSLRIQFFRNTPGDAVQLHAV